MFWKATLDSSWDYDIVTTIIYKLALETTRNRGKALDGTFEPRRISLLRIVKFVYLNITLPFEYTLRLLQLMCLMTKSILFGYSDVGRAILLNILLKIITETWFLVMEQISLVLKFLAIWQRLSCDTECDIILQIFLHGFCLWSDGLGKDTHHHRPPRFGELLSTDYCLMAPTWKASLFLLWEPWVCRNNSTVFVGVHMVYKSYMAENVNLHHALGKISVFSYCMQLQEVIVMYQLKKVVMNVWYSTQTVHWSSFQHSALELVAVASHQRCAIKL